MDLTRLIRDKMMKERLMFVYRGLVTNENSVPLLMLLENEMKDSDYGYVGRKRLFMFVLESLQNVSRHSNDNQHAKMSIVVYSKSDTGYTVTTGNVIPNAKVDGLKSRLDEVNNLETDEIRNVYRQMLSNAEFSSKGGAGLGLIEMAKKTGNKLDYDFIPVDDENSYFILSKTVDSGGVGLNEADPKEQFKGDFVTRLEKMMDENKIYLIWSGHMSHDIGKEVSSFTEAKLSEEADLEWMQKKRVFSTLIEMLDNVERNSPGQEIEEKHGKPITIMRFVDKVFYLTTGNLVLNVKVPELKSKLDEINSKNKEGLRDLFVKAIAEQITDDDSTGNMGLIEMAKKSGSKLDYQFETINDSYSYYMLTVSIKKNSEA